jgi:hypothetical protein
MILTPIEQAVIIANSGGNIVVTTADADGIPFMVIGGTLSATETGYIALEISIWPQIAANLQQNPHLTIVTWDEAEGVGYQLLGQVVNQAELSRLDSSTRLTATCRRNFR